MAALNKFGLRKKGSERNLYTDDHKSKSRSSRKENLIMYESSSDSSESDSDAEPDSQHSRGCVVIDGKREIYISSSTEDDSDTHSNGFSSSSDSEEIHDETQEFEEENSNLDDKIINANVVASSPVSDEENNLCSGISHADPSPTRENSSRLRNLRSESDNRRPSNASFQAPVDSVSLFFQYLELEARKLSDQKRKTLVNDFQNKLFEMQKD